MADPADESGPLTVVVTWRVRQGREPEFEAWRREISAAMPVLVRILKPWLGQNS